MASTTQESDLARELKKAEADVDAVRTRAARDRKLLDSGSGGAKGHVAPARASWSRSPADAEATSRTSCWT